MKNFPLMFLPLPRGDGAVFDKTSNKPLVFVSDADFSTFIRVEIDGATLDKKYYTVASGSTVVTISSDYLKALADGRHTVAIVSQGGTATAEFTVKSDSKTPGGTQPDPAKVPPNTSENTIIFITMLILVLCSGGVSAVIIIKRRRKC